MHSGNKPASPEALRDFLMTNVRRDGDCLIWAGALDKGRPSVNWGRRSYYAARLLAKLTGRLAWDAPKTRVVYHTCENRPLCMNPEHFTVSTFKRAAQYAARTRNAYHSGEAQRSIVSSLARGRAGAKLSIRDRPQVMAMRARGATLEEIAAAYDTTMYNVSQRIRRWNDILGNSNHGGTLDASNDEEDEPEREAA